TFIISSIDNLKFGMAGAGSMVGNKLGRISEFASQTIYELRDTIWAMNKTDISVEDLQARISNFIEKAKIATDVDFQFNVDNTLLKEAHFNSVQGMNIYRIIQEAINNALKYSEATEMEINFSLDEKTIRIEIRDNGKGFDEKTVEMGNGMNNMRKRARDIGGTLHIHSTSKGTAVIFN